MNVRLLTLLLLTLWVSVCSAGTALKPFYADSLKQIVGARNDSPFLLVLWSIDCPPCLQELARLQQLRDQFPDNALVLVSTDGRDSSVDVAQLLNDFQLQQVESWIFAESIPERLRYAIDPAWYGELPRAYFYQSAEQRRAHSGSLSKAELQQWLQRTGLNPVSGGSEK